MTARQLSMSAHTESIPMTQPKKSGFSWKWLFYPAIAIFLFVAANEFHVQDRLKQALDWVGQLGYWGAIIFIAIYVVATVPRPRIPSIPRRA